MALVQFMRQSTFMRTMKVYASNQKTIGFFLVLQSRGMYQNITSCSGPTPTSTLQY